MKKIVYSLLLCLSLSGLSYAFTIDEIPDKIYLTQHWVSYTTSFDIKTKTTTLGTLYRRNFSLLLTYDFYDNLNNLLTMATARFFSLGAHFDVYDDKKNLLGTVDETIFSFFPSFELYSRDSIKLARAAMNFWGTIFTLYDATTDKEIAVMYRSFFRVKNDWTIEIKNRALLKSRHIDPGLFMTVLAFQGDREYWEEQNDDSQRQSASLHTHKMEQQRVDKDFNQQIQAKIAKLTDEQNLNAVELLDPDSLEILAKKLERDYQSQLNGPSIVRDPEEKINDFINFCFDSVQSNQIDPSEKKAILYLMQQRIGVNPTETKQK